MKFWGLYFKIVFGLFLTLTFHTSNSSNELKCSNCIKIIPSKKDEMSTDNSTSNFNKTTRKPKPKPNTGVCLPLEESEVVKDPDYCMIYTFDTVEKVIEVIIEMGYKNYAGQPPVNTCKRLTKKMIEFNIDLGLIRIPNIARALKNAFGNYTTSGGTYCSCNTHFCNVYGSAPTWAPDYESNSKNANLTQESSIFSGGSTSSIIFIIGLAVILALILICGASAIFSWYKYSKVQNQLCTFPSTEIEDFWNGSQNRDPKDPYNWIYRLPFDRTMEIDKKWIEFSDEDVLGAGQFGIVYKGKLCLCKEGKGGKDKKEERITVAIKTVHAETVDVETFKSLLSEIKIMSYLATDKHENILLFLGASTSNIEHREALAIVEFCPNGDLLTFLRQRKDTFRNLFKNTESDKTNQNGESVFSNQKYVNPDILALSTVDLLKFSLGIANGMQHLTAKDMIHGDLAARNILLDGNLQVKISDFGLSRQLLNYSNYFKTTEVPLPFKWMSIEAMTARKFSIKSDVWSFGVVLYEIFTLGDIPYPGLVVDENFVLKIARGYRMEAPDYSNAEIYELMQDCWKDTASDRPSFSLLFQKLQDVYSPFSTMVSFLPPKI